MAENTTKDIWNDDDGAKEPPKKRRMLRKLLLFLLVLIAVLGFVLVAAWRDGTGFDALRRYFAYGTEAVGGEKTVYRYDTDSTNRFARVGTGSLVILSDTSLRLLGPDGSEVWSANVKMNAPALGQGGGLAVAYDIGGTALYVLDEEGPRLELTADGPLVSANLNGSGMLAVTTQTSMELRAGVLYFGWTWPKNFGSRPSRDMTKSTQLWPKLMTRRTEVRPQMAPTEIAAAPQ